MRAFHTLRTKNNAEFKLNDFELFTLILSALKWRQHNGDIFLYTDTTGRNFLDDAGILHLWNGVDTCLDAMNHSDIDEKIFWAGAKLFALTKQPLPCVMIDLDFIVWRHIDFAQYNSDIAVIHRESTDAPCYPDSNYFRFKNNFSLPQYLNWNLEPCNAALVYFGNDKFVNEYCRFAFEYMRAANPPNDQNGWDLLPYMVFIEQRWMAMCAEKLSVTIHSLSNLGDLFGGQKYFTHVWGYKQHLRENATAAEKFCRDCAGRIVHDFPAAADKLAACLWANNYFQK